MLEKSACGGQECGEGSSVLGPQCVWMVCSVLGREFVLGLEYILEQQFVCGRDCVLYRNCVLFLEGFES